jgi:DNA-binding NarL/FixJ family response regulator
VTEPAHAPTALTVLVAGNDPILRWGVAQYVALTLPAATIGEASSAAQALEMLRSGPCHLIVLDLTGSDDLAPINQLKQAAPHVPILVLSPEPAPATAKAAIAAGAAGYLSKGSPAPDWRTAIETVARGGIYPKPAAD